MPPCLPCLGVGAAAVPPARGIAAHPASPCPRGQPQACKAGQANYPALREASLQLWLVATARRLAPAGKQRRGGRACTWARGTEVACSRCARLPLAQGGCKGCESCDPHVALGCPAWSGHPFPARVTGRGGPCPAGSLAGMPGVGHRGDSHGEGPPGNGLSHVLLQAALCPGKEAPGSGTCYRWFPTAMCSPCQRGPCGAAGSRAVCSPHLRDGLFGELAQPVPPAPRRAHRSAAAVAAALAGAHFHSQGLLPAFSAQWVYLSPLTSPACRTVFPCSGPQGWPRRAGRARGRAPRGERAGWAAEALSEGGGCGAGLSSALAAGIGGAEALGRLSRGDMG